MRFRAAFSGMLAMGSTLVLTPLACGGAQDDALVQRAPSKQFEPSRRDVNVPDATAREMKNCTAEATSRLTDVSYALQYTLFANADGKVSKVKLRDATLHDAELEECFERALEAMTVPVDALGLRSSRPVSGGERMMREQRAPLGSSESETPLVFLGPLIVEAGGVQVLFEIGVVVLVGLANLIKDDEEDARRKCQIQYVDCLMTQVAGGNGSVHGETRCEWCRQQCVKDRGTWPASVVGTNNRRYSCAYRRK